jgi:hypothetical protein
VTAVLSRAMGAHWAKHSGKYPTPPRLEQVLTAVGAACGLRCALHIDIPFAHETGMHPRHPVDFFFLPDNPETLGLRGSG